MNHKEVTTQMLNIFIMLVLSRSDRIFCILSASLKKSEEWEVLWRKELGKHKHIDIVSSKC